MMATPTPAPNPNQLPPVAYAVFCGAIDQANAQLITNNLLGGIQRGVKHIHVLFQSAGGFIGDGIFLHNLLRSLPIETTLYNVGQISSAALTAYLGATNRKVSPQATFMIHRSTQTPQPATSKNLRHVGKSLALDDERTETILRSFMKLPDELWTQMQYHDLHLSAQEAVEYGVAHEIGDFGPPLGTLVHNMLAK